MDKKEFSTFAMALKTYFPRDNILPNNFAMELWYRELQDIPYPVAEAALREYVHTNKFAPSIAEIRAIAANVQNVPVPDWGEGWEQVLMAIRKYGSYRESEALESMDELTRTCVKRLGFRNICMSENIATDRANFRMIYEQLQERKKKDQQVALPLMNMIQTIQQKGLMAIEGKDGLKNEEGNRLLKGN